MGKLVPGQAITFYETPCIFLEERKESLFVIAKEQIKTVFGNDNNFKNSSLALFLNGKYLNELACGNIEDVVTRDVDLTALNGSKGYGRCEYKVATLTLDEIRCFRSLLPMPESWEWSVTPWSTPCMNKDDTCVVGLGIDGIVSSGNCALAHGTRPAFVISYEYFKYSKKDLSCYSDEELINELYKRHSKM